MKLLSFEQQLRLRRLAEDRDRRRVIREQKRRLRLLRLADDLDLAQKAQLAFANTHQPILLPRQRERIPLMIPEVLSLRGNHDETVALVKAMRDTVLLESRPVQLYFDKLRLLEPAAALLLVAEIFRCRQLRPWRAGHSVTGNYPTEKEILFQLRVRLIMFPGLIMLWRVCVRAA
jgi:hypothetical protein